MPKTLPHSEKDPEKTRLVPKSKPRAKYINGGASNSPERPHIMHFHPEEDPANLLPSLIDEDLAPMTKFVVTASSVTPSLRSRTREGLATLDETIDSTMERRDHLLPRLGTKISSQCRVISHPHDTEKFGLHCAAPSPVPNHAQLPDFESLLNAVLSNDHNVSSPRPHHRYFCNHPNDIERALCKKPTLDIVFGALLLCLMAVALCAIGMDCYGRRILSGRKNNNRTEKNDNRSLPPKDEEQQTAGIELPPLTHTPTSRFSANRSSIPRSSSRYTSFPKPPPISYMKPESSVKKDEDNAYETTSPTNAIREKSHRANLAHNGWEGLFDARMDESEEYRPAIWRSKKSGVGIKKLPGL